MSSHAARAVAKEVLGTLGKGRKPNITKIAIRKGYTPKTANSGAVQKTKSYQLVIGPVIQQLEIERQRAIDMMQKRIGKAKYRDVIDAVDKLTKNIQLLTGKSTSNISMRMRTLKDDELERIAAGGDERTGTA